MAPHCRLARAFFLFSRKIDGASLTRKVHEMSDLWILTWGGGGGGVEPVINVCSMDLAAAATITDTTDRKGKHKPRG